MGSRTLKIELKEIEKRFKEVGGLNGGDLSVFPLHKGEQLQVETDKQKSNMFGEVFTPLWLVDEMLMKLSSDPIEVGKKLYEAKSPLDLCAGYGQFTIRMLRCIYNYRSAQNKDFDICKWLKKHSFSEIQCESIYKLLYIFGPSINIYIGDAIYLNSLEDTEKGILIYDGKQWVNITKEYKNKFGTIKKYDIIEEQDFCDWLQEIPEKNKSVQTSIFNF